VSDVVTRHPPDIYTITADGSSVRRLTHDDMRPPGAVAPAWSPDAAGFAYVAPDQRIHVANADGTGDRVLTSAPPRRLRRDEGFHDNTPTWSPDGRWVAFVRYTVRAHPEHLIGQIWEVRADGRRAHPVFRFRGGNDIQGLDWSATGDHLAFITATGHLGGHLYEINPNGRHLRPLRRTPAYAGVDWSPDGRRLVTTKVRNDTATGLVIIAGAREMRLTSGDDQSAVWSPDGTQIAFIHTIQAANLTRAPGKFELDAINPDGSGRRTIATFDGYSAGLDWQH